MVEVWLCILLCFLTCWHVWQVRVFRERERELREREAELLNRLLKQAHVAPISPTVERERVVKLPDPEIPPLTWQDQAFRDDDILEDLEQRFPDARGLTVEQAKALYPADWKTLEWAWDEAHTPLRS